MNTTDHKIQKLSRLFLVAFVITAGMLFYWQIVAASSLTTRPENPRLYQAQQAVHRGTVYDRNNVVLARTTFDMHNVPTRSYPIGSFGALLGYHSSRLGDAGLEGVYNDFLNGQGRGQPADNTVRSLLHEPVVGDDIHLTVDARIQDIVTTAMGTGSGACIVADTRTGEILALDSQPWVDPNKIDDPAYMSMMQARSDSPFVNRALQGLYAPGSVFKTVTLAAAYDSGLYDTSTILSGQDATGPLYVNGFLMRSSINNLPPGVTAVSTVDAYKYSDNIAFATIGMKLGPVTFFDYASRFGFGGPIPFDLPLRTSRVTSHRDTFSQLDLAESAFGQDEVEATPLQMLMVAEGVAGGGVIRKPYVVDHISAPGGETIQQTSPALWKTAMSAVSAAKVTTAMEAVVQSPGGSGYLARIPGTLVAGKTGTAEVTKGAPHAWFIAFAPADHPRIAVVVFKEHGGEGYSQAAPLAGMILKRSLPLVP